MGGGRDMEAQDLYQMGLELCVEAGVLEECEFHEGTYFQGNSELEEAYKLANVKISRGEFGEPRKENRKEVTDAIKLAYDDNSFALQCYQCEKAFGPD